MMFSETVVTFLSPFQCHLYTKNFNSPTSNSKTFQYHLKLTNKFKNVQKSKFKRITKHHINKQIQIFYLDGILDQKALPS